jgi:hypothetical protein
MPMIPAEQMRISDRVRVSSGFAGSTVGVIEDVELVGDKVWFRFADQPTSGWWTRDSGVLVERLD